MVETTAWITLSILTVQLITRITNEAIKTGIVANNRDLERKHISWSVWTKIEKQETDNDVEMLNKKTSLFLITEKSVYAIKN